MLKKFPEFIKLYSATWFLLTSLFVLNCYIDRQFGSAQCEFSPGDSNYGEPYWSWVPLGVGCIWEKEKVIGIPEDVIREPSWFLSVVAGVLIVVNPVFVNIVYKARRKN